MTSIRTLAVLFALIASGLPAFADCPPSRKAFFGGAVLEPGSHSAQLASELARTADYGSHAGGWLAARLFALDDDVEITGTIDKSGGCFEHESDDDLTFFVILSAESRKQLGRYFAPPDKTPYAVEVEMVASLSAVGGEVPFRTWRHGTPSHMIEFAAGKESFRPIEAEGADARDWTALQAPEWKYVSVRGALVVDMGHYGAGSGELEIHPARRVRLTRDLPDHH